MCPRHGEHFGFSFIYVPFQGADKLQAGRFLRCCLAEDSDWYIFFHYFVVSLTTTTKNGIRIESGRTQDGKKLCNLCQATKAPSLILYAIDLKRALKPTKLSFSTALH